MEEPCPSRFMRVHRSYIVQKDKIRIIDRGRIVFGKDIATNSFSRIFRPKKLKKIDSSVDKIGKAVDLL